MTNENTPTDAASVLSDGLATVYLDDTGNPVVVGYDKYRKTSYVDDGRAIPDSWKRLVVANLTVMLGGL